MFSVLVLGTASALAALPAMQPDTPPPPPVEVSRLASLKTMQDVIAVSMLSNGERAPAHLVLPELQNRRQTLEFMRVHYPKSMMKVVTSTTPIAWVHVDEAGRVASARLLTGSGHAALDSLSIQALAVASFTPARIGESKVGVWVPYPARIPPHDELLGMLAADGRPRSEAPIETPYTEKPKLLNRNQVEAAIVRVLAGANRQLAEINEMFNRSQRIGGRTDLWIYIDEAGAVQNALVKKTSGNTDLDTSALQIAKLMRFSPARNGQTPVDVWIEVPIAFKAN